MLWYVQYDCKGPSKKRQGRSEKMSALDELIEVADRLCVNLENASADEKKFCQDVCEELERYSYEVFKMTNGIRELKQYYGG